MMVCMADMEHLDCTARERQLRERPLCRFCMEWGRVTRAAVVARGDDGRTLVSLCAECHADPLDPRHPAYGRGR